MMERSIAQPAIKQDARAARKGQVSTTCITRAFFCAGTDR